MRTAPRTEFGRGERLLALSGGALLLVLLALFHFIRIDGAVIAAGRATEAGAPVAVQSPGDGLVRAVLVRDGEMVAAGDVLLRLDPALLEARRDLLRDRLDELRRRRARQAGAAAPARRAARAAYEQARLDLARVTRALDHLEIRAPVAGIVQGLEGTAAGMAVAPGDRLLWVSPLAEAGVFDLEVTPRAMASVHMGQPVRMRFPALASRVTPVLEGRITRIADSRSDRAPGQLFYRVAVTVPPEQIARLGNAALPPGMPVQAFLQTGRRSILSYLLQPLSDQVLRAFREG